jgi:hypothetical protein
MPKLAPVAQNVTLSEIGSLQIVINLVNMGQGGPLIQSEWRPYKKRDIRASWPRGTWLWRERWRCVLRSHKPRDSLVPLETGGGEEGSVFRGSAGNTALNITWFITSGLRKFEKRSFCCVTSLNKLCSTLWNLATAAVGRKHGCHIEMWSKDKSPQSTHQSPPNFSPWFTQICFSYLSVWKGGVSSLGQSL